MLPLSYNVVVTTICSCIVFNAVQQYMVICFIVEATVDQ